MSETYAITGTCRTNSPTEGRTVRIVGGPFFSTDDTAEETLLATDDTSENRYCEPTKLQQESSLSTEDTTLLMSATESLSYLNRYAAMGPIYSEFA